MEVCYYDARHYITNSSTRYHCGECCARISKERNTIDNSESDPNYCWWSEMTEICPAWHTPMERHHLRGCENYETKKPNVPRKRLKSDLGLDSTSRAISTATNTAAVSTNHTSNSNTNSKREDADSEPPPIQIQPPTTPPDVPDPNPQHSTNTTNQAAEGQPVGVQLPLQGGYAVTHQYKLSSLRKMIAQQNTHDVDELGSTFFRETKQTSQLIYGFEVFQDYRAALKTQKRKAIYTVDENGTHLTKYCGIC
jgi:hypothetical protein